MEVEAVEEGKIAKLLVAGGTEGVKVNAPIAILLEEDEDESALEGFVGGAAPAPKTPKPASEAPKAATPEPVAPKPAPKAAASSGDTEADKTIYFGVVVRPRDIMSWIISRSVKGLVLIFHVILELLDVQARLFCNIINAFWSKAAGLHQGRMHC